MLEVMELELIFLHKVICDLAFQSLFPITSDFLNGLFKDAGFVVEKSQLHSKEVENRKEQKKMNRLWIQGVYKKV